MGNRTALFPIVQYAPDKITQCYYERNVKSGESFRKYQTPSILFVFMVTILHNPLNLPQGDAPYEKH